MIIVDANILLYAYNASALEHARARAWLEEVLSGSEPVRFSWMVVLAFLRVGTNPSIFTAPLSVTHATSVVNAWFQQPCVGMLEPGERHWGILRTLLATSQARGALVMDAHLAALAIEHGATLCTADRDFKRFEGLRIDFSLEGHGNA